jgi:hypothetical protein
VTDFSDLKGRLDAVFSGPFLQRFKDLTFTVEEQGKEPEQKPFRFVILGNVNEGYKHYALVGSKLGPEWPTLVGDGGISTYVNELTEGVRIQWGKSGTEKSEFDQLHKLPFSKRVFIFTDELGIPTEQVNKDLAVQDMKGIIIDDEDWAERNGARKPDIFITHDSRDKDAFVRDLFINLARRHFTCVRTRPDPLSRASRCLRRPR